RAPATPLLVSLAPVELRNHEQPPALRRREMAGQRGDLSLQPLERQAGERVLILPHIHDVLLGPCDEWGKWPIERVFDYISRAPTTATGRGRRPGRCGRRRAPGTPTAPRRGRSRGGCRSRRRRTRRSAATLRWRGRRGPCAPT